MLTLKIKEIRISKNISQEELAKRVGCDRSYISKLENNKTNSTTTLHMLDNIIKALNVTPHDIFDFCDNCIHKINKK